MYSQTTTSGTATFNDSLDTKYTVAELLSSLANGGLTPTGLTPTSQYPTSSMPSFVSEAQTPTSNLLTPSTLTSIEQTFIELQSVPSTGPVVTSSHVTQSGFVPPIVSAQSYSSPHNDMVIKREYPAEYYSDESSQDPDWAPEEPSMKRMRTGDVTSTTPRRTGPRGRRSDSDLTPDEMQKRMVRRERNKLAAAKCRQRRVDLTNTLQDQTDVLESEKSNLETEIQQLQSQKEQLEFLLQAHTPVCAAKEKLHQNPRTTCTSAALSRPTSLPLTTTVTTRAVSVNVSEATGVPITTPSQVFGTFGFENIMNEHTGLTPLTGTAPTCASEMQRNNSDNSGSSPSDLSSPTTLMAL